MASKEVNDGGSAYPRDVVDGWGERYRQSGMSLLDYYIGQAEMGLCTLHGEDEISTAAIATLACDIGVATLKERNLISGDTAGEAELKS